MAGSDNFEMPSTMEMNTATATPRHAKFITEPWENGFGNTLGNSLRRVLLTMMEGVAVSCIRIDGISHEFTSIPGVMEDVMEIILNIKKLKFRCDGSLPRTLELVASEKGEVTGAAIKEDGVAVVLNKDLKLFTLTANLKDKPIRIELDLDKGRGYRPSERNKRDEQPLNSIPIDCLFSPIEKVRYDVQPSRVGENTNYDRLELEVWTDERIDPKAAVMKAAQILRRHLEVFEFGDAENASSVIKLNEDERKLVEKLSANISTLGLSVRSVNCLNQDNIHFVGELVQKTEGQMMKCRNFGRVSLNEIRDKLQEMGLSLEMTLNNNVAEELAHRMASQLQTTTKE
ncbi:MAG: DNA-directed RNA polymerase subunit alpha [Lentisphaeria bacterium]|nr:DNA-directed RNA polymerase subunit alpha [Lentisphaeria bacterium]